VFNWRFPFWSWNGRLHPPTGWGADGEKKGISRERREKKRDLERQNSKQNPILLMLNSSSRKGEESEKQKEEEGKRKDDQGHREQKERRKDGGEAR